MPPTFRDLLEGDSITVVPGCYDALTAKIIEKQGFDAVYMSGAGVSNTQLGIADVGLTHQGEMVDQVAHIAEAVQVPVFADADTGYGNALHVQRTTRLYEQVGASALHLEDQTFPKRCGHFEGQELVPVEEMTAKLRAAVDARDDLVVVARTDARAVEGVDEAIERANAYVEAGADMVFPEAPQSREEMERFCTEINAPVMANMVEDGKTPMLPVDELQEIGFDLVIFPNSMLRAAMVTMQEVAEHIQEEGTTADLEGIADFELRNALTDYDRVKDLENKYAT